MKRSPLAVALSFVAFAAIAEAAPQASHSPPNEPPTNLRAHVGTDQVASLLHSADADERIRGIERAASLGTRESVALLVETVEQNSRGIVTLARALAKFADQDAVRARLLTIVTGSASSAGRAPPPPSANRPASDDADSAARIELARDIAAIALARSGGDRALESLYGYARGSGSGQQAALHALALFPPREPGFFGTPGAPLPVAALRLLGQLGDLRALDVLHATARSNDVALRSAALVSLAELGDERAIGLARSAIAESDSRLREAAGEVFILLAAPERFKATAALIADEATTTIGIRMAERVHSPEITKLVGARASTHPNREIRAQAIRALGRSPDPEAAKALTVPPLLDDGELAYHAYDALSRSPAPNAGALIGERLGSKSGSLAARAYVVRALARGERTSASDEAVFRLASAQQPALRALGVFARVALGDADATDFLGAKEPRVRQAAAMAAPARGVSASVERALLERLARESDAVTRQVLAIGLASGDPDGIVKTSSLVESAESAGGDAPVAAFALARRVDATTARKVGELLTSRDPTIRAHTARGLSSASLPDATGRLAGAYAYETDAGVRRAIIAALAARTDDASAPLRKETLDVASNLDPDGPTRQLARRALLQRTASFAPPKTQEVAWIRLTRADGDPPGRPFVGSVVRSDGLAIPVVFDEDGHALVPALPPGEARLVLAPALPPYKETQK